MKIKPKSTQETSSQKKIILPLFLALIMVMSVFGVFLGGLSEGNESGTIAINGFDFVPQSNGRWMVKDTDFSLDLQNGPYDLGSLPASFDVIPLQQATKVYVSYDPQSSYFNALPDLVINLKTRVLVVPSCYEELPGCEQLPLKTCQDAAADVGVVILMLSEENSFVQEGSCYTLKGTPDSLNKVADALLLSYFGVTL